MPQKHRHYDTFVSEWYTQKNAALLLTSTDMPIADISLKVGFSSQSHFTATFKKYKNVTPLNDRKMGYLKYQSVIKTEMQKAAASKAKLRR